MSQSITLYRISQDNFNDLENSTANSYFDESLAKELVTFQGSSIAIEYILTKDINPANAGTIAKIFNPDQYFGIKNFKHLSPEKQFELYESGKIMPYLDPATIAEVHILIDRILDNDIIYNSAELNENGIYPEIWHNDESEGLAYNKRQVIEDLSNLKSIFKTANIEKDYILAIS